MSVSATHLSAKSMTVNEVVASNGSTSHGTPLGHRTHSEIYKEVLLAMVIVVERSDSPGRLCDSDDDDDELQHI